MPARDHGIPSLSSRSTSYRCYLPLMPVRLCTEHLVSSLNHRSHRSPARLTLHRTGQRKQQNLHYSCKAGKEDRLQQAAAQYAAGLKEGADADDLVAQELGVGNASQLSDTQERYKEKIRQKLEEQARAAEEEKAARYREFSLGKLAYAKGDYPTSVQYFTAALDREGPFSPMGGEIQLWLALGYQATGRHQDCIDLYRVLEDTHPNVKIKRQAANLRFIMEAPKLKLGPDERVSVPVLATPNRFAPERSMRTRAMPSAGQSRKKRELTWEERFFAEYRPPQLVPNNYVLVAGIILAIGLAWYSASLK